MRALASRLTPSSSQSDDVTVEPDVELLWGQILSSLSALARWNGIDLESIARREALRLRDEIVAAEGLS